MTSPFAITTGYKGFLAARLIWREGLAHTAGPDLGAAGTACHHFVNLEREAARFDDGSDVLYERLLLHLVAVRSSTDGRYGCAELDLRMRLPESLPPQAAIQWLEHHSPGWTVACEGGVEAWCGPRSSPLTRHLGRAIAAQGRRAQHLRKAGTADLNLLAPAWGCPALAYGPGDSSLDHTPDEHIELAEYVAAVEILTQLLGDEGLARALEPDVVCAEG